MSDKPQRTNRPTRIKLAVYVDLDPVPGMFHTPEAAQNVIGSYLLNTLGDYNPVVSIQSRDVSELRRFTGE